MSLAQYYLIKGKYESRFYEEIDKAIIYLKHYGIRLPKLSFSKIQELNSVFRIFELVSLVPMIIVALFIYLPVNNIIGVIINGHTVREIIYNLPSFLSTTILDTFLEIGIDNTTNGIRVLISSVIIYLLLISIRKRIGHHYFVKKVTSLRASKKDKLIDLSKKPNFDKYAFLNKNK